MSLGDLTQTYTGSPSAHAVGDDGAGKPLAIYATGAPQTNAGSYPVTATVDDANYQGSAN